ncbi:hypothetical protein B0H13DRAFT_119323 [Mycena leptocephala]|nr:hypothetical protein B0H13DRAFT_119323 [Mycena leptocephala]
MVLFLPVELVREIIAYVLVVPPATVSDELGANLKPNWSLIRSLSIASKTYRTLALEAWFRVLFTRSPGDLVFLRSQLQEIHSWTQEIHCVSSHPPLSDVWDLTGFCRLRTIRLDSSSISYRDFPFHVSASVTELDLRGMSWPSPYIFQTVAATFPQLITLQFSQSRIWCGLCHTCSRVKFAEPVPPKLVYREGLGLPIHYARALSPLQHLRTVSIVVPYSRGTHILLNPSDPARDLWAGECDRCVGIMYDDDNFRERWIARKKGILLSDSGALDSERLYIKPPALETVEWTFRNSDKGDKEVEDEDEDETVENEDDDEGEMAEAEDEEDVAPGINNEE